MGGYRRRDRPAHHFRDDFWTSSSDGVRLLSTLDISDLTTARLPQHPQKRHFYRILGILWRTSDGNILGGSATHIHITLFGVGETLRKHPSFLCHAWAHKSDREGLCVFSRIGNGVGHGSPRRLKRKNKMIFLGGQGGFGVPAPLEEGFPGAQWRPAGRLEKCAAEAIPPSNGFSLPCSTELVL